MTRAQLRRRGLSAPRRGVRVAKATTNDPLADLRAYAARIPAGAAFCGESAARIYGLPHPDSPKPRPTSQTPATPAQPAPPPAVDESPQPIYVAAARGRSKPRGVGIVGRRLSKPMFQVRTFRRLPVLQPVETFLSCCGSLTVEDAVVMLDALLTNKSHYPGLRLNQRPAATMKTLEARLQEVGSIPGIGIARQALALARRRVASPMETRLRLLLVRSGLPEPEVNGIVKSPAGDWSAEIDLLYREAMIAVEYEGDVHRTDEKTFRRDLERERRLRALGYEYVRVTVTAMGEDGTLIADLRALLARRTNPPAASVAPSTH